MSLKTCNYYCIKIELGVFEEYVENVTDLSLERYRDIICWVVVTMLLVRVAYVINSKMKLIM